MEPWIDADPSNAGNLIGVWQQDRYSNGGANGLGVGVSRDGGRSWTQVPPASLPRFTRCQGASPGSGGDYERASDPWVSFGPDGDAYQISLSFNETRDQANAMLVSESQDAGTSWGPVAVLRRDTSPLVFNDKEALTADQTDANYVYASWDRLEQFPDGSFAGPTWFARTTNGGASWEPARPILDPGRNDQTLGNQIVVMPDGDLVNSFALFKDGSRTVSVMRSTDKGAGWGAATTVSTLESVGVTDPRNGAAVRTGEDLPEPASDERAGSDNVYLVWQDARFTAGQRDQIAFSRSRDGGLTWSPPKRISTAPTTQAFTPAIRVSAQGEIGVTYYDFRNDSAASAPLDTDLWFLHSTDGGETFSEERVTPTSFDMSAAPIARGYFVGDYSGLAAHGAVFEPFFTQVGRAGTGADVFATTVRAPFGQLPSTPTPYPQPQPQPEPAVPSPARGRVTVGRRGRLGRRTAVVRLRCSGGEACRGIIRLSASIATRGRRRTVILGARSFQLQPGTRSLRVRLGRRARKLTAKRRRIRAVAQIVARDDRHSSRVLLRRR